MTSICKVKNCRYSETHTTIAHCCGTCHEFGHGRIEHSYSESKDNLRQYFSDEMPEEEQCTIEGCNHKSSHNNEAHHCSICGDRGSHGAFNCPTYSRNTGRSTYSNDSQTIEVKCPQCQDSKPMTKIKINEENKPSAEHLVYGVSGPCIVCFDTIDTTRIRLDCGHANLCWDCTNKIHDS